MTIDEKLDKIIETMNSRFDEVDSRFDKIEADIKVLKEDNEEFRSNLNTILEWTDEVGGLLQVDLIKRD